MRRGVAASDKRGGFIGDPSKGVEGIRPSEKKLPCQNNNNGGEVRNKKVGTGRKEKVVHFKI